MNIQNCLYCDRSIITNEPCSLAACVECEDFAKINGECEEDVDSLSYVDYMRSGHWIAIRSIKIRHSGGKCAVCSSTLLLHVHHREYPERRLEITPSLLVVLCKRCHEATHA